MRSILYFIFYEMLHNANMQGIHVLLTKSGIFYLEKKSYFKSQFLITNLEA